MDLAKAIDELLSFEPTRKSWEKNWKSKEFIAADKLAKALNHSLKSACSDCLNDLFILAKIYKRDKNKLELKQEVMNSNYELFPTGCFSFPKRGIHITNANLTDEIAKDYLNTYPAAKVHFKTIPESHYSKKVVVKEKTVDITIEESKQLDEAITNHSKKVVTETLRKIADRIADEKGIKKPHWKASDYTLELFVKENS